MGLIENMNLNAWLKFGKSMCIWKIILQVDSQDYIQ